MGQASRKQVQAILRRAAERAEKDNRERGVATSFRESSDEKKRGPSE